MVDGTSVLDTRGIIDPRCGPLLASVVTARCGMMRPANRDDSLEYRGSVWHMVS